MIYILEGYNATYATDELQLRRMLIAHHRKVNNREIIIKGVTQPENIYNYGYIYYRFVKDDGSISTSGFDPSWRFREVNMFCDARKNLDDGIEFEWSD